MTESQKGLLLIRDKSPDKGDQLKWRWLKGDVTATADLGNPVTGTTIYSVCLYDRAAGTPSLLWSAIIPPGGTCAGKPCWTSVSSGTGVKYSDKNLAIRGVRYLQLKAGTTAGKAKVAVLAKGANLGFLALEPLLPLQQDPTVTIQVTNTDGKCWTAKYSTPAKKNQADQFLDKGD